MNIYVLFWAILSLISILLELTSPGYFFFLSISLASLLTTFISWLNIDFIGQIFLFITSFMIFLLILRRYVLNNLNCCKSGSKYTTNVYALKDKHALVTQEIMPYRRGWVKIDSELWAASSSDNQIITSGSIVKVVAIKGSHVIVEPLEK